MNTESLIALVGHCGPDAFMLRTAVSRAVPGATLEMVNDQRTLDPLLTSRTVLLVNRVLDGPFDASDGIELIAAVTAGDDAPVALLVSNFDHAQAAATAAGGHPGFGKNDLYEERTASLLRAACGL
ncbi:MAG: hypothetical protein ACYTF9_08025 [Planctomycetota bacterium]|jgi:hypothetical protein